jgi:hypothetical protein
MKADIVIGLGKPYFSIIKENEEVEKIDLE